jgi:ParB family transcriptional regulator, chromosome partitioning protein
MDPVTRMRPRTGIDASDAELRQIPVDKIDRNPQNPRLVFRQEETEKLIESIRLYGIQVPVSVFKKGSRYVLIDGERRWLCSLKLNLKTIPALVQPEPSQLDNLLLMFNIHWLREQWDFLTIAMKLPKVIELLQAEGLKANDRELAMRTGLPMSRIAKARLLMQLPQMYRDMMLDELRKPKAQQSLSEDFFIEMEKSLKTVSRRMPDVVPDIDVARRALIKKYRSHTIGNIIDFRELGKIARAKTVDADEEASRSALTKLFHDNSYSINDAYAESVSVAYAERDVATSVSSLTQKLQQFHPDDIDDDLRAELESLRELIDRLLDERAG